MRVSASRHTPLAASDPCLPDVPSVPVVVIAAVRIDPVRPPLETTAAAYRNDECLTRPTSERPPRATRQAVKAAGGASFGMRRGREDESF